MSTSIEVVPIIGAVDKIFQKLFCFIFFRKKEICLILRFIQWKPLNVITLRWMKTDNINQMITITGSFYIVNWTYET
jgi:hypothetical protein